MTTAVRRPKTMFLHESSDESEAVHAKLATASRSVAFSRPPEVISIDSDSDDTRRIPPNLPPPQPSLLPPGQRAPEGAPVQPTARGRSPAAAVGPATLSAAQPVRLKINLRGKAVASFTSSLSSTTTTSLSSPVKWDREPPCDSPPLSPIITAANLPPDQPVVYPRYTNEAHLRDYAEGGYPTLDEYLASLRTNFLPAVGNNVVCLDGDDDDDQTGAISHLAFVREKVALARSFGRLDAGGPELQAEHQEREELFDEQQIAFLPLSGGFCTQQDHLLEDIYCAHRSIIISSKDRRRTATCVAEIIEDFWAKKEGRDAKSLKCVPSFCLPPSPTLCSHADCVTLHFWHLREQEKARKAGARKVAKEIRAKWSLAVDVRVWLLISLLHA